MRKALPAQSRQLGAKPHWNGSRLYNFLSESRLSHHYSPHLRLATEVVPNEVRKALIAQSRQPAQRLPDEALISAPWYYPFAAVPPPPPNAAVAGQEMHGVPGFMAVTNHHPPQINSSGGPRQCRSRAQTGARKAARSSARYPVQAGQAQTGA